MILIYNCGHFAPSADLLSLVRRWDSSYVENIKLHNVEVILSMLWRSKVRNLFPATCWHVKNVSYKWRVAISDATWMICLNDQIVGNYSCNNVSFYNTSLIAFYRLYILSLKNKICAHEWLSVIYILHITRFTLPSSLDRLSFPSRKGYLVNFVFSFTNP